MKVLITGAQGFIGKNLVSTLENFDEFELLLFDRESTDTDLKNYIQDAEFIIHLAGVNRPKSNNEFYQGNTDLTAKICELLIQKNKKTPVFFSSSIQVPLDNDYGKSKSMAEEELRLLHEANGNIIYIYRLPNVFGKWSKPFYNSVVATWCYQIANNEEIEISDPSIQLELLYIDDLIKEIILVIQGNKEFIPDNYYQVNPTYKITLGELAQTIKSFNKSRETLYINDMSNPLERALYSTYLNFIPNDSFKYPLKMNIDERGSFTEFIKSKTSGQVSVNISKPGVIKGEHWHHSKNEKFMVVSGMALIKFRDIFSNEVIEYKVSGDKLEVVDIPTGYTHNIENVGTQDLVTIMWVNEPFDPDQPDTYYNKVEELD